MGVIFLWLFLRQEFMIYQSSGKVFLTSTFILNFIKKLPHHLLYEVYKINSFFFFFLDIVTCTTLFTTCWIREKLLLSKCIINQFSTDFNNVWAQGCESESDNCSTKLKLHVKCILGNFVAAAALFTLHIFSLSLLKI
jgi:hypothetical protein